MGPRERLLRWYDRHRRDLPWRRTRDPYRVWVSEIMLQQTRVETVIPYYERFLERFPDVESLARARLEEVLSLWSGLGYYQRARRLHAAAHEIVREHEGAFPRDLESARGLPGVGRSTAGAILSIGYGEPAPVLDGNVRRVLARRFAARAAAGAPSLERRLWELAQSLVAGERPGDVNQALMELGATVCLPGAAARCSRCPLRSDCAAFARGLVDRLPAKERARPPRSETWAVAVAQRGGRFLVRRREDGALLGGLFELPTCELAARAARDPARRRAALAAFLQSRLGLRAAIGGELLVRRYGISNRAVTERVFAAEVRGRPRPPARFVRASKVTALPVTTATRRILARVAHERARHAPLNPA
jgi:A/G-specific adenine glycosylase